MSAGARRAHGRPTSAVDTVRSLLLGSAKVRYLVDSAAHLGRFYLNERAVDEEETTVWLEGPDGQVFCPSDVLPVLSREGNRVVLTGADMVLAWLVNPRRGPDEIRMGLRYLSQWPEGPQASLTRLDR